MIIAFLSILQAKADTPAAPVLDGCWDVAVKLHRFAPSLCGRFSFAVTGDTLGGTVMLHGEEHPIREGAATADSFRFNADLSGRPSHFEGRRGGAGPAGTVARSGSELAWNASRCAVP